MEETFWKHYTPSQLENEIQHNPITKERLYNLGKNNYLDVVFLEMESSPESKGFIMFCGCENSVPKYKIFINNLIKEEEQKITLVHELIHVYYRCGKTILGSLDDKNVEDIIERETLKAASSYPFLINWIFESLLHNSNT